MGELAAEPVDMAGISAVGLKDRRGRSIESMQSRTAHSPDESTLVMGT